MYSYLQNVKTNVSNAKRKRPKIIKSLKSKKAGSIGKSHAGEKEFWTKQEFKQFLAKVGDKLEPQIAFLVLYWTGMRIGGYNTGCRKGFGIQIGNRWYANKKKLDAWLDKNAS